MSTFTKPFRIHVLTENVSIFMFKITNSKNLLNLIEKKRTLLAISQSKTATFIQMLFINAHCGFLLNCQRTAFTWKVRLSFISTLDMRRQTGGRLVFSHHFAFLDFSKTNAAIAFFLLFSCFFLCRKWTWLS